MLVLSASIDPSQSQLLDTQVATALMKCTYTRIVDCIGVFLHDPLVLAEALDYFYAMEELPVVAQNTTGLKSWCKSAVYQTKLK